MRRQMNDLLRLEDDQEQRFIEHAQRILQLSEEKENLESQLNATEEDYSARVRFLEAALEQSKFQNVNLQEDLHSALDAQRSIENENFKMRVGIIQYTVKSR